MSAATHILLTTDFSEASEEAVAKAGEMARVTGARLTVPNVHHHVPPAPEAAAPAEKVVRHADCPVLVVPHASSVVEAAGTDNR